MRRSALAVLVPLLLAACASHPPQKIGGKYALQVDPSLESGRAAYGLGALHGPLVAALRERVELVDRVEEADAVIVLRPGPHHETLSYDIIRGLNVVASHVTEAKTLVRPGELRTLGEQLEAQRRSDARRSSTDGGGRPMTIGSALPHAEEEEERRTRAITAANRIASQIVRDLAALPL